MINNRLKTFFKYPLALLLALIITIFYYKGLGINFTETNVSSIIVAFIIITIIVYAAIRFIIFMVSKIRN
jgi:L-lactate permease